MIRVIVVDDEGPAREQLCRMIGGDRDFEIAGEASGGQEALQKIQTLKPDAVFLDIEMPGLSGLDLAGRLAAWEEPPVVVFATAYHRYAVQAFEANAVDYILKPYDPARLKKTLERLKGLASEKKISEREKLVLLEDYLIKQGTLKKIAAHPRNSKERIVMDPSQIYYFHAELSEVRAHTGKEHLIVNSTLKEMIQTLGAGRFAQCHKAYLVNLDKVEKITPFFSGNFHIILNDSAKTKIPLSRRYARNIKSLLGW
jgi:two-component system response regulator LytT